MSIMEEVAGALEQSVDHGDIHRQTTATHGLFDTVDHKELDKSVEDLQKSVE